MIPTVLITRPEPQASAFLAAIRSATDTAFASVLSPLISFEPTNTIVDLADQAIPIFTSVNGVRFAEFENRRPGSRAWCVGDQTARAAGDAGFDAVSAAGDASDLIKVILDGGDTAPLVHVRGAQTTGQIAQKLSRAGRACRERIVYRQTYRALSEEALNALSSGTSVLVPVFSPRTAQALFNQGPYSAEVVVFAMSKAALDACGPDMARNGRIANRPDQESMVAAICAALGGK